MDKFVEDLKKKELIPLKLLSFLVYGGQAAVYPFLTLHLFSLGLNLWSLAAILAIQPLFALLVHPFVSLLTTRLSNVKALFVFFLFFTAITVNCLQLVPRAEINGELKFNLHCGYRNFSTKLFFKANESCNIEPRYFSENITKISSAPLDLEFYVKRCSAVCSTPQQEAQTSKIFKFCFRSATSPDRLKNCLHIGREGKFVFRGLQLYEWNRHRNENLSHDIRLLEYDDHIYQNLVCDENLRMQGCKVICDAVAEDSGEICSDLTEKISEADWTRTFWAYLAVRSLASIGIGMINVLFDASAACLVSGCKADLRYQRIWIMLAVAIVTPLSGFILKREQPESLHRSSFLLRGDYYMCFYVSAGFYLLSALITTLMNMDIKMLSPRITFPMMKIVISEPEVIRLLVSMVILGVSWGFLENYFLLFLDTTFDVSGWILGLVVTVNALTVLLMNPVSATITKKLRPDNVITISLLLYGLRFFAYWVVSETKWCLILEVFGALTVIALTAAVAVQAAQIVHLQMMNTVMSLWNAAHFIIGKSMGSLVGGLMVTYLGWRRTFFYFGCIFISFAVMNWLTVNMLLLRRKKSDSTTEMNQSTVASLTHAPRISSLVVNYIESTGFTSFSSSALVRKSITEISTNDMQLRTVPRSISNSLESKPKATSYRKNSLVANYRSSLAPVPEEMCVSETAVSSQNGFGQLPLGDRGTGRK